MVGADGRLEWPGGRPTERTYTPRRFDAEAGTLEVWFVLHGDGPAARWAARAEPGSRAAIGGPGGRFSVDATATSWWIGGDESALPAIATLLEALPGHVTGQVHLEVEGAEDCIDLPAHPSVQVVWHDRAGEPGAVLVDALRQADIGDETHVWVACEALAVRKARSHLLDGRGLPRVQVTTHPAPRGRRLFSRPEGLEDLPRSGLRAKKARAEDEFGPLNLIPPAGRAVGGTRRQAQGSPP